MTTPQSPPTRWPICPRRGCPCGWTTCPGSACSPATCNELIADQAHRRGHHQPVDLPGRADRRRRPTSSSSTNWPPAAPTSTTPSARSPPTTYATPATCSPAIFQATGHVDGRVSIEVDPRLAHDTAGHHRAGPGTAKIVDRPNVLIKIPATLAGLPAITAVDRRGHQRQRHPDLLPGPVRGRDGRLPRPGWNRPRPAATTSAQIHSVASFFVSRVDSEIDKRLKAIGTPEAAALEGEAAIANARLAYQAYEQTFAGDRWDALEAAGRQQATPAVGIHRRQGPQVRRHPLRRRTRRPGHGQHRTGEDHRRRRRPRRHPRQHHRGHLRRRPRRCSPRLEALGIDLDDVFDVLETEGVEKFEQSWSELLDSVADALAKRKPTQRITGGRRFAPAAVRTGTPGRPSGKDSTAMAVHPVNPLRDPRDKRLPRIAGPSGIVIFGVTGDLVRKKLMPAIYDLANRGLLPPGFALVGFARRDWANEDFAKVVHDAVREYARTPFSEEVWRHLAEGFRFVQGAFDDDDAFDTLAQTLADLDRVRGTGGNHAFYFSIPPGAFPVVLKQLKRSGLCEPHGEEWRRVVIEKPFGHDLKSAPGTEQPGRTTSSRESACSGSITTWARKRSRTCWRCGSPTSCTSRSGTTTTSTTCRSPRPRTSASAAGPATTTASAPPATSSRTICCS